LINFLKFLFNLENFKLIEFVTIHYVPLNKIVDSNVFSANICIMIWFTFTNIVSCGLALDAEVIFATAYPEVAVHTPFVSIGVAHAPVLRSFLILAPAVNHDRVV